MEQGYTLQTDFSSISTEMAGGGAKFPVSPPQGFLSVIRSIVPQPASSGNGTVLKVTYSGEEPAVQNRTHDHYINIAHPKQETVRYAMQELSAIAHCVGHIRVGNTNELIGKRLRVVTALDTANEQQEKYPGSTRVIGYCDINGNKPGSAGPGVSGNAAAFTGQPQNTQQGQPQTTQQAGQSFVDPNAGASGWNGQGQPQAGQNGGQNAGSGQQSSFDPNAMNPNGFGAQQNVQPQNTQPQNTQPQGGGTWGAGAGGQQGGGAPSWSNNG